MNSESQGDAAYVIDQTLNVASSDIRLNNSGTLPTNDDRRVKTRRPPPSRPSAASGVNEGPHELFLIPMHPVARKLTTKQLPIVLGRTNLAGWWWKSCPCQNYCRLHCRPVAQNIRSLSKIMTQIDTQGRFHIVGKNPHLITITPEREDNILRENDIISVGRPDREPWMRFQAIRKPASGQPIVAASFAIRQCTTATPLEPNHDTNARRSTANRRTNSTSKASTPVTSNLPEWITTNSRKRKSGNSSSNSLSSLSRVPQVTLEEERSRSQSINESIPRTSFPRERRQSRLSHNEPVTAFESNRKRRHRGTQGEGKTGKDFKYRRSSRGTRMGNDVDPFDRVIVGNSATAVNRDHSRRRVHLIFQDYKTSASLLEGNEIRRKSESNINKATANADRDESLHRHPQQEDHTNPSVRDHPQGQETSPRPFFADTAQLRLLSRNFVQALLGAVSPVGSEEVKPRFQEDSASEAGGVIGNAEMKFPSKTEGFITEQAYQKQVGDLPPFTDDEEVLGTLVGHSNKEGELDLPENDDDDDDDDDDSILSVPVCPPSSSL